MERIPPKEMAKKLAQQLRPQRPDYQYLKHVFHHVRAILDVTPVGTDKRLPELLTDQELIAFYPKFRPNILHLMCKCFTLLFLLQS